MRAPAPDVGARLRTAREARGLDQREAAELLNLMPRYIAALESCDWKRMPAAAYTRGYLRKYASLLGLDPNTIVAEYVALVGDDRDPFLLEKRVRRRRPLHEFVQAHPGTALAAGVGATVMVFVTALWLLWPLATAQRAAQNALAGSALESAPAVDDATVTRTAANIPPAGAQRLTVNVAPGGTYRLPMAGAASAPVALPTIGTTSTPLVPAAATAGEPESSTSPAPETAVMPSADPAPEAAAPAVAPGQTNRPAVDDIAFTVGDGGRELRFSFSDDCWIEVHDGTGARLVSDMRRRGEDLIVRGEPPFNLTVGYAPAVSVQFEGEQVDLEPHTRNLVASLTVGAADR